MAAAQSQASEIIPLSNRETEKVKNELDHLIDTLPKFSAWNYTLHMYQGLWFHEIALRGALTRQRHFQALDTDIILASRPKCGTTWLKALSFAIVNRHRFNTSSSGHPLLKSNPHQLVPFIEVELYKEKSLFPELIPIVSPRLLATHIPYQILPESINNSGCPIIYICRNPLDAFASYWHFTIKIVADTKDDIPSLEKAFDQYCQGIDWRGPFWDHVLGYWKESLNRPNKVLFLMYEEMRQDIQSHLKKIAEFQGVPFSVAEEEMGKVEEISRLCSFENLKALEVNKSGTFEFAGFNIDNKSYFRKAQVGDYVNLLSPSMIQRYNKILQEKLDGSLLAFMKVNI